MKTKLVLILAAAHFAAACSVRAYNHKWTGAASDAWSNAQNWTNGAVNPTENRAIRLFFPINDFNQTMRQDIDGLSVDYLEFHGAYTIQGGPGTRLSFRNTNADPATATIHGAAGYFTFADDLELRLNQRVNVNAYFDGRPDVVSGQFNGRITGPGDLYLSGGRVEFAGGQANTYSGITVTTADTLRLNKSGVIAVPGDLVIGFGPGGGNNSKDKVLFLQNNQLAADAQVTVNGSGWLNLDGHVQTVAGLTLTAGQVSTDVGTLSLAGNVTSNPGNVDALIEGRLALGFVPRTFTIGGRYTNEGLRVNARISGDSAATLIKNGTGTLRLTGPNTYNGTTVVNDGVLIANGATPLGSSIGGTIVNAGATLHVEQADLGDEPLTLAGQGDDDLGAVFVFGSSTGNGPVALAADTGITVWPGHTLNLNGVVSGPGGMEFVSGTVALGGDAANTYSGETRVLSTTLELRKRITILGGGVGLVAVPGPLEIGSGIATVRLFYDNQIANTSPVTLSGQGQLDLNGQTDTIGSLAGSGTVDLGDGELAIGGNATSTTSAAVIFGVGGRLRKIGPATLTLTATNTHTGATTVEDGMLVINGVQASSAVIVKTNATLAGFGTVGTITSQGGIVSPGVGPGRLNSKGVAFDSTSIFRAELNGQFAGVSYDQLNVAGALHLSGCALDVVLNFVGSAGNQYTIIANDGSDAVIGTFAGKPEGATFAFGGATFQITYHGGDGNDVVLTQLAASTQDFAPALAIESNAAGQALLHWTTNAVGFYVERASSLPANAWQPVPGVPLVIADRFTLAIPASTNAAFFRLAKP
jgi:autotransporter-associated beta strand protein